MNHVVDKETTDYTIGHYESNDLKAAVIEWRQARLAVFAAITEAFVTGKKDVRLPNEVWERLGNAEWRLAELAEKIE